MLRLLDLEYRDPCQNMAVEEALLMSVDRRQAPNTVRFWRNENTVVVGRAQKLEAEVNLESCREYGTSIVRRFTGGGSVYQDRGNLNWTIVTSNDHPTVKFGGIEETFRHLSDPILVGIRNLGVEAEFQPPNSIFVDGKKVSGMAIYVKRRAILCHGTLLISTNLKVLNSVLRLVKTEVMNLQTKLNTENAMSMIKTAIKSQIYTMYDAEALPGRLSIEEQQIMKELHFSKYATDAWNLSLKSG